MRPLPLALALFGLAGCAPTTAVTETWKAPHAEAVHRLLVVAPNATPRNRRVLEGRFAHELARKGVAAGPAAALFPDGLPTLDDPAIAAHGYDGVLVLARSRVNPTSQEWVNRGYLSWSFTWDFDDDVRPGPLQAHCEVSLFHQGRLVWTGATETLDPSTDVELVDSVSRAIAPVVADVAAKGG